MYWQELRQQVLERDEYTCQICLKKVDKLDIHHIIPRRKNGLDSINNLTSVCESCHGLIETKPKKYSIPRKMTILSVSIGLRNELAKLGTKGDTYESIIWRLIKNE
jgi:hypothetical protein